MSRDDDNLLGRWSRRKRAVAEAERSSVPDRASSLSAPAEEDSQGPDEALSEPELLEKLGLPDPDTLQKGDNFTAFMAKHIPAALRRRALRRLWLSDPVLANLDGLLDHGEDFTDAATVPKVFRTAYQVGRGFVREVLDTPTPPGSTDTAPDVESDDDVIAVTNSPDAPPDPPTIAQSDAPDPENDAPRPRRMAFRSGNLSNSGN